MSPFFVLVMPVFIHHVKNKGATDKIIRMDITSSYPFGNYIVGISFRPGSNEVNV